MNKQGDKDNIATVVLVNKMAWLVSSAQNSDVIAQAAADPVLHMNK